MTLFGFWAMTLCQLLQCSHFQLELPKCKDFKAYICMKTVAPCNNERLFDWKPTFSIWLTHLITTYHFLIKAYWLFFTMWGCTVLQWLFTANGVMRVKLAARQLTGITTGPLSLMRLETTGLREKSAAPSAVCYLPTDSSTHLGLSMGLSCLRGTWVNEG